MKEQDEMETVDLIASGYEWVCPKCGKLNHEIEVTETVTCHDDEDCDGCGKGCGKTYETESPEHAYS